MMRRVLMLGLLTLQAWAGACSPIPPSDGYLKASQALLEAVAKNQNACQGLSQVNCTVYNAVPYQVVEWLRQMGETWQKTGTHWENFNERYGRTSTLNAIGGGTIVKTTDRLTAWERLEKRLYAMKNTRLPLQTCRSLGLNDVAYRISACQWRTESDRRDMTFKITAATDKSLPAGLYEWQDGATCGYSLRGPRESETGGFSMTLTITNEVE